MPSRLDGWRRLRAGRNGQPDPLLSPLFADFKGAPPMLIQVGSAETLLDDAVSLAGAAGAGDVAVRLENGRT